MSKSKLGGGLRHNDRFAGLTEGKVHIRCEANDPGAVKLQKKNGEYYYTQIYDNFCGYIEKIEFRPNNLEEGKEDCTITFNTNEERKTKLQIRVGGGYWFNFSKMILNADLTQPITLIPQMTVDGEKKSVSLFLEQGGKYLKSAYTKDDPKDLPQGEKHVIGKGAAAKTVWDFSEQNDFLKEKMLAMPKYEGFDQASFETENTVDLGKTKIDKALEDPTTQDDDLPF